MTPRRQRQAALLLGIVLTAAPVGAQTDAQDASAAPDEAAGLRDDAVGGAQHGPAKPGQAQPIDPDKPGDAPPNEEASAQAPTASTAEVDADLDKPTAAVAEKTGKRLLTGEPEQQTAVDAQKKNAEIERQQRLRKGKRRKKFGDPNPADATFLAIASALGSFGGGAVVAATVGIVFYVGSNIVQILPPQFVQEYGRWGALGLVPIGISLFAIPVGAAFGTWWGAGLRGLPLSLNNALINMAVGLLMGASAGVTVMTPIGLLLGGAFSVPPYFASGSSLRLGIGEQSLSRPVWALVVVPFGASVAGAFIGATFGGVVGPVITGSRWGYWAEGDYVE